MSEARIVATYNIGVAMHIILVQKQVSPLISSVHVQVYDLSAQFLPKEWIMEKWEEGYYITAMAGSTGGSSLVVMSKGTPYTQQSYKARLCRTPPCSMVPYLADPPLDAR